MSSYVLTIQEVFHNVAYDMFQVTDIFYFRDALLGAMLTDDQIEYIIFTIS